MRARNGTAPATITRATATLQNRLQIENCPTQKAGDRTHDKESSWGENDPRDSFVSSSGAREGTLQSLVRRNNALILELMKLRDSNERLRVGLHSAQSNLLLRAAQSVAPPIAPFIASPVTAAAVKAPPITTSASTQTESSEESSTNLTEEAETLMTSDQASQTVLSGGRRRAGRKWNLMQAVSGITESSDSEQPTPHVARKVKFVNSSLQLRSLLSEENGVNETLSLTVPSRMHLKASGELWNHSSPSCSPRSPFSPFAEGPDSDSEAQDETDSKSDTPVLGRAPTSVTKLFPVAMSPVRASGLTSQLRRSSGKSSGRGSGKLLTSASSPASALEPHEPSEEPPWSAGPGSYSPVPFSCDWLSPQTGHSPVKAARKRRSQMVVRQDSLQALGRPPAGSAHQGKMGGGGGGDQDGV